MHGQSTSWVDLGEKASGSFTGKWIKQIIDSLGRLEAFLDATVLKAMPCVPYSMVEIHILVNG